MPYKDLNKRRECCKRYCEENKERIKETHKNWNENNKDKVRKINKKYYAKNHEKLKHKAKEWSRKNREVINKKQKIFRKNNPERFKARYKVKRVPLKKSCEICNSIIRLERHHWRYDKPLMINTLCKKCHVIQHIGKFHESIYGGILKSPN